jgi:hypothetical protein
MIYGITLILLALLAPPEGPSPVCGPEWTGLFAPVQPRMGRYEVCPIGEDRPAGFQYADSEQLEALDAFGTAGSFSRARLVQLFGGRRVTVTRGWRLDGSRFESITLLTPYPDPTLTRLNPGTLAIRWISARP